MLRKKTPGRFLWTAFGLVLFAVQPGFGDAGPYPNGACCTNYGCEAAYPIGGGYYCCNGICQPGKFGGTCLPVCCSVNGGYVTKSQACCYTGIVSGQDCDGSGFDDRCERDCNHDGVINACEDNPGEQDCDYDGVCNGADIAACPGGAANCDCNTNDLPDDCESWDPWFTTESKYAPYYYAGFSPTPPLAEHRINNAPRAVPGTLVYVSLKTRADLEAVNEFVTVRLGVGISAPSVGGAYDENTISGVTCGTYNDSLTVTAEAFNNSLDLPANGGAAVFQFVASSFVDNTCTGSFMQVSVSYQTAEDCDYDLVPDVCDLDCEADPGNPGCADCQPNGSTDRCDIRTAVSLDCQAGMEDPGEGIPDECDLVCASGQDWCSDCNDNGIPDNCDVDCDEDDVPDSCEIAACPACNNPGCDDCNMNLVPDSCDIAATPSLDCPLYVTGRNGIPDSCEIALGDGNANGVADSCDLASGAHPDCDLDGVSDDAQDAAEAVGSRYIAIRFRYGKLPDGVSPPVLTSTYALSVMPKAPWATSCVRQFVQNDKTLGPTPVYKTPAQWCGYGVNVRDEIIIPETQYTVEAFLLGSTVPKLLGQPFTHVWGDVSGPRAASDCPWGPPDGIVTVDDCLAIQARISNAVAPPLTRADIRGIAGCFAADGFVNVTDLQVCNLIAANPYGYLYPCPNPPCGGGGGQQAD